MPAPKTSIPTTGSDPRYTSKSVLEGEIDRVIKITYDQANPEDRQAAEESAQIAVDARDAIVNDAATADNAAKTAVASAEASGDVRFFDDKAAADGALSGLSNGQIVEVIQDESIFNARTRYRVESGSYGLKLLFGLDAVPDLAALAAIPALYDGQVARVVDQRLFGHFKWRSGNVSAQVSADPFAGLWVPPAWAPSGASGAWQRMVEKGAYDAEWWLPDTMPTDADANMNSAIGLITDPYATFLMPRREVLISDMISLSKGLTYEGAGMACPVDGQGGNFYCFGVTANNARLNNISAGNVTGTLNSGEPGGFRLQKFDDGAERTLENISVRDCHAYEAVQGIRVGFNGAWTGGAPDTGDYLGYATRDVYIENFQCEEIGRIGIECMRAHGVEVVGGTIRMAETYPPGGTRRGTRIVGANVITFIGTRFVAMPAVCVSIEESDINGNFKGSKDVTIEGCSLETTYESVRVQLACERVLINGCRGHGANDESASIFLSLKGSMEPGEANKNITVTGCQSINQETFFYLGGRVLGVDVTDNTFISSDAASPRFFTSTGNPNNEEMIGARFTGNTGIAPASGAGGFFRYANTTTLTTITVDDNAFVADGGGDSVNVYGQGTLYMKRPGSNRIVPNDLWATLRPDLSQTEYL
ncbi:hypothetical protein [Tranquillimonas rosea]|uniref:hypothetical protein n=1 Tax=Tranquillimonas rosea TaxID=641238 RepID=UPI003BAC616A